MAPGVQDDPFELGGLALPRIANLSVVRMGMGGSVLLSPFFSVIFVETRKTS